MSDLRHEVLVLGRPHPTSSSGSEGGMSAFGWVGIAASVVLPLAIVAVVFGRIFRGMAEVPSW